MIGNSIINTVHGDFRTYLPIGPDFSGISFSGELSAYDAEIIEKQRKLKWAKDAYDATPEVIDRLTAMVKSDCYYDWYAALHCFCLPNNLCIEVAENMGNLDETRLVQLLVDTVYARMMQLRARHKSLEEAVETGRDAIACWSWFGDSFKTSNITPQNVAKRKQELDELQSTLAEKLAKSKYYCAMIVAAKFTSSTELLTKLARRCAKITKNLDRRNQLTKAIVESPAINEAAVFELMQAQRVTRKYVSDDIAIAHNVWLPALRTHKINKAIIARAKQIITEEKYSDAYRAGYGMYEGWLRFYTFSDCIDEMEEIIQRYAEL